jgi:hypothetical protein
MPVTPMGEPGRLLLSRHEARPVCDTMPGCGRDRASVSEIAN